MIKEEIFSKIYDAVLSNQKEEALKWVQRGIDEGIDPLEIIVEGLKKGIEEVGERFGRYEMFLPEMIGSAKVFEAAIEVLNPEIKKQGKEQKKLGRVVMGTVHGDIHDLGKNIVGLLYGVNGFEVIDIGVDVPDEKFVEAVKTHQPQVLGLSAMLSNTREKQRDVIGALNDSGLRSQVKVIIGGAVVNDKWCREIGADAFAVDAQTAIERTRQFLGASE